MELLYTGVRVQALCPGFTHTEFHCVRDYRENGFDKNVIPKTMWMEADDVVRKSLRAVQKDKIIFIPGFKNRILLWLLNTWLGKQIAIERLKKMGRIRKTQVER